MTENYSSFNGLSYKPQALNETRCLFPVLENECIDASGILFKINTLTESRWIFLVDAMKLDKRVAFFAFLVIKIVP